MTFDQVTYMVLETVRNNYLVDDENLDHRLIQDWVNMKRAQFLKNKSVSNGDRISINNYQVVDVTLSLENSYETGQQYNWPFIDNTTQDSQILVSSTTIPRIIESRTGPMVLSIESTDKMKLPFSFVDYDRLRFSGNGKFNSGLVFGAIRDGYLFFKYNPLFDTLNKVKLRAVFEDPRAVDGFDNSTSDYPCDINVIEYIKNAIYDIDIKILMNKESDKSNDASGSI